MSTGTSSPDAGLDELAAWCLERGWTTSLQGRKLYCVPAPISKEAAVAEVRRRSGAGLLVAAGDSRLDAGILELADIAIRPPTENSTASVCAGRT